MVLCCLFLMSVSVMFHLRYYSSLVSVADLVATFWERAGHLVDHILFSLYFVYL